MQVNKKIRYKQTKSTWNFNHPHGPLCPFYIPLFRFHFIHLHAFGGWLSNTYSMKSSLFYLSSLLYPFIHTFFTYSSVFKWWSNTLICGGVRDCRTFCSIFGLYSLGWGHSTKCRMRFNWYAIDETMCKTWIMVQLNNLRMKHSTIPLHRHTHSLHLLDILTNHESKKGVLQQMRRGQRKSMYMCVVCNPRRVLLLWKLFFKLCR